MKDFLKSIAKNMAPMVLIVLIVLLATFFIFIFFPAKKNNIPQTVDLEAKTPKKTELVDYHPVPDISMDYKTFEGKCDPGSIYSDRNDVYTCSSGNTKFDACFKLQNSRFLFCGVDPLNDQTGAIFNPSNEIKQNSQQNKTDRSSYLLMQLQNGIICYPMGTIEIKINGQKAAFQCSDGNVIFSTPTKNNTFWTIDVATLAEDQKNKPWSIEKTQTATIAKIWQ